MEEAFWQDRWKNQQIGFHEAVPNPLLTAHFGALNLAPNSAIFVPLCGKTLDIDWLLARGHPVVGVEFHEAAIQEVFARLELAPEISEVAGLTRYHAGDLTLYCGDFFSLRRAHLPSVGAVFDRAALVAVAPAQRQAYVDHMRLLSDEAPILLVSFDYDPSLKVGPPFSVSGAEIDRLMRGIMTRGVLQSTPITSPPKAVGHGVEEVHLLRRQ
ncbi:thiopurine S-methyltransferase [Shimia sp. R11_0]|uniref:thiopurine S-methyltransferase n=1 Tax=Shimia sp. R11_0 TaxID=2821096 RepID=UPI001ADB58AD|nr:thiopurine S-methyltransferase [Shimia sp. R11_0]MBO9476882.1 thiopurine S-methyltransferase [Shimia sp. R11_0]